MHQIDLFTPSKGSTVEKEITLPKEIIYKCYNLIVETEFTNNKILIELFSCKDTALNLTEFTDKHLSWVILSIISCFKALSKNEQVVTFSSAFKWFFGSSSSIEATDIIDKKALLNIENEINNLPNSYFKTILPYILDHHGFGTRRNVLKISSNLEARKSKKNTGVFYTPWDLSLYMANWVLKKDYNGTLIDPACGTGIFLLAAAKIKLENGCTAEEIVKTLYGIDIDPISISLSCFVLSTYLSPHCDSLSPFQLWHLFRLNITNYDTVSLLKTQDEMNYPIETFSREELNVQIKKSPFLENSSKSNKRPIAKLIDLFPETKGDFKCLLANPPYSPIGNRLDFKTLTAAFNLPDNTRLNSKSNIFLAFIQSMWKFTNYGRAIIVVPMSISYNSSGLFKSTRKVIMNQPGSWKFSFFDRTPDSIFGDDVKQRASIISYSKKVEDKNFNISTTEIIRWTSNTRKELFSKIKHKQLNDVNIIDKIPKFSANWESELFSKISISRKLDCNLLLEDKPLKYGREQLIKVGKTAYNYFSIYPCSSEKLNFVENKDFYFPNTFTLFSIYAILCSNLVYWLWRVEEDSFHVPANFIKRLPIGVVNQPNLIAKLDSLGQAIWEKAKEQPIISKNKGRETVSYKTHNIEEIICVDKILVNSLGATAMNAIELSKFVSNNVSVGRE
ncbi:N-6 DNA methylase [Rufibacter tibetensis]|uniref:site-specific DNA-methyltransferase (adenine-specific) n=1 Tax=Rufibacter tibetensis TaxID=512763 RepID=A0A0P0CM65_9BACT|nr:N-6 DNA methylase [Rufibacter tibetensis]ALJ00791.1 hypothetical protein DC20_19630 [Rufibacter tibetensis]